MNEVFNLALDPKYERRFMGLVGTGAPDTCWEWRGPRTVAGYGQMEINGRQYLAHRLAYRRFRGDPGDKFCCHKCDNPPCCNPNHIWLGDRVDNAQDMVTKERHCFGERSYNATLTDDEVNQVWDLYNSGVYFQREIAAIYGVKQVTVSGIVRGASHKISLQRAGRPAIPHRIGRAVLGPQEVAEIHDLYASGLFEQKEIAGWYGIVQTTVSQIVRKKTWASPSTEVSRSSVGVRNGRAKLTKTEVQQIRDLWKYGVYFQREIAELYGVAEGTVWHVVNGATW